MVTIRGRYVYDDEDLTPGKKREGGLHQNLFDAGGNLKASARFIPDDDQSPVFDPYSWASASPTWADTEEAPGLSQEEREQLRALLEKVIVPLLVVAFERGAPHAQRLWRSKVRPAVRARLDGMRRRLPRRGRRVDPEVSAVLEGTVVEVAHTETAGEPKVTMAASEAEARYLLAMTLRQASDEQLRLLTEATVVADDQAVAEGREVQVKADLDAAPLLDRLSAEPASLTTNEVLTAIHLLFSADRAHGPQRRLAGTPSSAVGPAADPKV